MGTTDPGAETKKKMPPKSPNLSRWTPRHSSDESACRGTTVRRGSRR
jgi:hypothetical protein